MLNNNYYRVNFRSTALLWTCAATPAACLWPQTPWSQLKYQRIQYPLLKNKNNKFEKISWSKALNILNFKINNTDASKIKTIIGNLTDIESIFFLKKNFNQIGVSNIIFEDYLKKKNLKLNSDITSNFLFNQSVKNIKNSDLCLLINSNIRNEGSILNIHLINRIKKGNFEIAYIGNKVNYTYPINHLGLNTNTLINILIGKHFFCKKIKKAKNPLIIFGENILNQKNFYFLYLKFKSLFFIKNNINFFNSKTSFINFLEITFLNYKDTNSNFIYLYNTNLKNKLNNIKNKYIVYQGHHFTEDAQKSNLILPGLSFLEKEGTYINIEGIIQKNKKILNLKTKKKKILIKKCKN